MNFLYSDEVHTPAPDFFELKPVLTSQQAVDESRSERSQLPTLWRQDVPGGAAYYKNKPYHQETYFPSPFSYSIGSLRTANLSSIQFENVMEKLII